MEFVIITGMSGSGKSRAIAAMEDIGYYCVDNLPPKMVRAFTDLCMQADQKRSRSSSMRAAGRFSEIFSMSWKNFLSRQAVFASCFLTATTPPLSSVIRKHAAAIR